MKRRIETQHEIDDGNALRPGEALFHTMRFMQCANKSLGSFSIVQKRFL